MPRFGQYIFYIVVACIALISGTLPLVLTGAVSIALAWWVVLLVYQALVVKKKAPIVELSELVKKNSTEYDVMNLDPVMLVLLDELNHHFSRNNDGSHAAVSRSFCSYFGLSDMRSDPFLLEKRILFEYKKKTGSLKKKVLRINDIQLSDLLVPMVPTVKVEFRDFCLETKSSKSVD